MALKLVDGKEIRVPGRANPEAQRRQGALEIMDGLPLSIFRSLKLHGQHKLLADAWKEKGDDGKYQENCIKWLKCLVDDAPVYVMSHKDAMVKLPAEQQICIIGMVMEKREYGYASRLAKACGLKELEVKAAKLDYEDLIDKTRDQPYYSLALKVAEKHNLGSELIKAAAMEVYKEYENSIRTDRAGAIGGYDVAAKIAKKYGLGKELERKAAELGLHECLAEKNYDAKEDYNAAIRILKNHLSEIVDNTFIAAICEDQKKKGHLKNVAYIAKEFGLDSEIVMRAAKIAYEREMDKNKWENAVQIAKDFGFEKSLTGDQRAKERCEYNMREADRKTKIRAKCCYYEEPSIIDHYREAAFIAKNFGLRELEIKAAEKIMEDCMERESYDQAAHVANYHALDKDYVKKRASMAFASHIHLAGLDCGHGDGASLAKKIAEIFELCQPELIEKIVKSVD